MKNPTILIVDDDPKICFAFEKTFQARKYRTLIASNGRDAIEIVKEALPLVVFMDVSMPGMDGLEALEEIKKCRREIPVVIITGHGSMQTAIRAMQLGAYDYLTKPLDIDKVRITAQRALETLDMRMQINELKRRLDEHMARRGTEIVGQVAAMQDVYKKIGVISTTPNTANVLILGETGTGKELAARAIHESGPHPDEPFLAINCTVLPENLLESELFGHERGAFTGADRRKLGKFEVAGNGTVFLDEIGDMPSPIQKKLLRVVQERTFERLGSHEPIPLRARIIAATHRDLAQAVRKGEFREDLYYRMNVIEMVLPPLRERVDDIPLLANHFLKKYVTRFSKRISLISPCAMDSLRKYPFPGNVRELENVIERAVALERGNVLTADSFPPGLFRPQEPLALDVPIPDENFTAAKAQVIAAFEKRFIKERLRATCGNVSEAARAAGIERQSFQRLMKKHGISSEDFRGVRLQPSRGRPATER